MADSSSFLQQLDSQLEFLFTSWNIYTTLLFLVLTVYFAYPLFVFTEPDTHPLLLARQAIAAPVRQPGESAVYRSQEAPHGYPLRTGLNVRDEGTPKWSQGRDGDLRDIWRQALKGLKGVDGQQNIDPGKVLAVMGKETIDFELNKLTKEIISVRAYLKQHNAKRVAILLPNSVELLVSFFAAAFANTTLLLMPQDASSEAVCSILREFGADTLIASAGALPLESVQDFKVSLRQIVWVAEANSRHMDWHEVPAGVGGKTEIAIWHEILEESTGEDLPEDDISEASMAKVVFAMPVQDHNEGKLELIEFEQKNIVAAIAAQISALSSPQRLGPSDVFLSLLPFSDQYALIMLLTALYSNSSITLSSSSGSTIEYTTAFRGRVQPTVILTSPKTLALHLESNAKKSKSKLREFRDYQACRALAEGRFPISTAISATPRLIYTTQGADSTSLLNAKQLSELRVLTGARIINAFTDPRVAGAIAQTHVFDYRVAELTSETGDEPSHFGPPLSCLEVKLLETGEKKWEEGKRQAGRLMVEGPAVVGERVEVDDVVMTMTDSNTLAFANDWLMK